MHIVSQGSGEIVRLPITASSRTKRITFNRAGRVKCSCTKRRTGSRAERGLREAKKRKLPEGGATVHAQRNNHRVLMSFHLRTEEGEFLSSTSSEGKASKRGLHRRKGENPK